MAQGLLEEAAINPTIELPELTWDWGYRLFEGTNRTLCAPDPGEGTVTPQQTDPDMCVSVQESLVEVWVGSSLLQGWGISLAVHVWDLLKEDMIIFITSTIVWPQVINRGAPRGTTPPWRSGAPPERSYPTFKELLSWSRRAERIKGRPSTIKVRRSGCEKIPLVQGKEQRLCFAGAEVKRYPTSKVRETQVRR